MKKSADAESTCSAAGGQRKRGFSRFSLRQLIYSSPIFGRRLRRAPSSTSKTNRSGKDAVDGSSTETNGQAQLQQAASRTSVFAGCAKNGGMVECPLCLSELHVDEFPELSACGHRSCYSCLQQYIRIEILESRVCITCPECTEPVHPNEIRTILDDQVLYEKYEDFMVRRVLAVDPDTRWCPAPDCNFAVIATGCASCPRLKCERPGCSAHFCYHCKAEWHPNQTCDAARAQRSPNVRSSSISFSQDSQHKDVVKPCPRCQVPIVKMDDGSCNHMMCAVCGAEFCWLCMKEISDLHYLSPSGCTFWGKKPWSRKKKILWQLGTLVGAPVGIALIAGIAVPAMIIGIPVWVGRKLYNRYMADNKHKRNAAILGGVTAAILISPVLAGLAVGIGVPILLFYVYGVVPVSLCRSGGCGVSTSSTGVKFDFDDENDLMSQISTRNQDNTSIDAVSNRGANPSIGEASLSMVSGSQVLRLGHETDHESASNIAIAGVSLTGSIGSSSVPAGQRLEVQAEVSSNQRFSLTSETASAITSFSEKSANASLADDGAASTRALAGSVLNYKISEDETCICAPQVGEDCYSERVRFDNNVSFIGDGKSSFHGGRPSSAASSLAGRHPRAVAGRSDGPVDGDSVSIDMSGQRAEERPKTTAALRNLFFYSTLYESSKPAPAKGGGSLEGSPERAGLPVIPEPGDLASSSRSLAVVSNESINLIEVSVLL